ncbi:MAG: hypothetical protein Q9160_000250 [Pyrenula sp. 1 TL-2023]
MAQTTLPLSYPPSPLAVRAWSTDISYWLNNSLPTGYQNQSSAWFFGGENVTFRGYGVGTLDGNGQAWYDFVNGQSNYPRRPHAITIFNTHNSLFDGLRFVQSQMWTMTISHSTHTVLQSLYINSTSSTRSPARNTDGADTIFSSSITFRNLTIANGDDSIALKANSTNILIEDCTFHRGLGVAIGSIGQYPGQFETVENVTARRIRGVGIRHAGYVKTWTGQQVGYPPNGGGGGLGFARNVTFEDFTIEGATDSAFAISQCTTFSGAAGDCDSSLFQLRDFHFGPVMGTLASGNTKVASLQCSKAAPCRGVEITGVDLRLANGTAAGQYLCSGVEGTSGFNCTGTACVGGSAAGGC